AAAEVASPDADAQGLRTVVLHERQPDRSAVANQLVRADELFVLAEVDLLGEFQNVLDDAAGAPLAAVLTAGDAGFGGVELTFSPGRGPARRSGQPFWARTTRRRGAAITRCGRSGRYLSGAWLLQLHGDHAGVLEDADEFGGQGSNRGVGVEPGGDGSGDRCDLHLLDVEIGRAS